MQILEIKIERFKVGQKKNLTFKDQKNCIYNLTKPTLLLEMLYTQMYYFQKAIILG